MTALGLHELHESLRARFGDLAGSEVVHNYGDTLAEHTALRSTVGVMDLGFRGRLCLVGADRVRFLNGQVTNNVNALKAGTGCYAALTTNKGKIESDLNIHALEDELLLDFEPGLTAKVTARLEKFIVADEVQVVDAAPHYGLLSVQGPLAAATVLQLNLFPRVPVQPFQSAKASDATLGELYLMNLPRLTVPGFDLFVPIAGMAAVADKLIAAARSAGGGACGWQALEIARIEAGIPRYGADMDELTLPQEAGIEARAVSFTKGCYIGQEVINRIRSIGSVTRGLRGLRLADGLIALPGRGDMLVLNGREVGRVTSATASPALGWNIALGLVRKECNGLGTEMMVRSVEGEFPARIMELPFRA